jgi:hypothetical protein
MRLDEEGHNRWRGGRRFSSTIVYCIAEWVKMDDVSALLGAIAVIFGVLMIGVSGAKRWPSHGLLFVVGALLAIAGFGVEVADMLAQRSSAPSADQSQA